MVLPCCFSRRQLVDLTLRLQFPEPCFGGIGLFSQRMDVQMDAAHGLFRDQGHVPFGHQPFSGHQPAKGKVQERIRNPVKHVFHMLNPHGFREHADLVAVVPANGFAVRRQDDIPAGAGYQPFAFGTPALQRNLRGAGF